MRKKGQFRRIITLTLILILGLTFSSQAQELVSNKVFSDIDNHWASTEIIDWLDLGFVKGYEDGTFRPNNSITRAEFATLTNRTLGLAETAPVVFDDVTKDAWYYDEIAKAVAKGYLSGYEDGTVRPNGQITRAEAATVIAKALNLSEQNIINLDEFTDAKTIADWAKPYISLVLSNEFMSGYPDGSFKAANNITRAESVSLLDRVYQKQEVNYNAAGSYGPTEGIETMKKDVNINVEDVTLENMLIEGNLYLNPGIGEGDVYLNNVTVTGQTIVSGGGNASVYLINFNGEELIINKVEGPVRIVILENAVIENISLETNTRIEIPEKAVINTIKATSRAEIELETGAQITVLILDAEAVVTGEGQIENAEINVEGVILETPPENLIQAEGVTTEIAGKKVTDGIEEVEEPEEPEIEDSEDDEWYPPAPSNFTYAGDRDIWVILGTGHFVNPEVTDKVGHAVTPIITYTDGDQIIEADEVLTNTEDTYTLTYSAAGYNDLVIKVVITNITASTLTEKDYYAADEELEFEISGLKPNEEIAVNILIHTGKAGGPPWAFDETVLDSIDEVYKADENGVLLVEGIVQPDLSYGELHITLPDYLCYIDNSINLRDSKGDHVKVGYQDLTYEGTLEIYLIVGDNYEAPVVKDEGEKVVTPTVTNEAGEEAVVSTDTVETYILTYSATGYNDLVIIVRVSADIGVSELGQRYYDENDTLQFTISGLTANEDVKVGMPIWIGTGGDPWACNEEVLDDMTEEGDTIRYWVGTTDDNGVLTVSGTVKPNLPNGELRITLPEYGYVINNAIRLEDDQGNSVRVGALVNFTYAGEKEIYFEVGADYIAPDVKDADGKAVEPTTITDLAGDPVEVKTDKVETYILTYSIAGYNELVITVKVTNITVGNLAKSYYIEGENLTFTISGLDPNEIIKVGMPIWIGFIEPDGDPWASNKKILDDMPEEEENGKTIRHWVGTTDANGALTVSGTVQEDLPSGRIHITLPGYGYNIMNAIKLQDNNGASVRVGDPIDFTYDGERDIWVILKTNHYKNPEVKDADENAVTPTITNAAGGEAVVSTNAIETYTLTYNAAGYNKLEITVQITDITIDGLDKNYYAAGETLEFVIKGLKSNEEVDVNLLIFTGIIDPEQPPWAFGVTVLDNINEVHKADKDGVLVINGTVHQDLPSGELHITLPDYLCYIDNSITLQDKQGAIVRVGPKNLTYDGHNTIYYKVGEAYVAPIVTDEAENEVTLIVTTEAGANAEVSTTAVETYILTYSAAGYNDLVIIVRVSANIDVSKLTQSYYAAGDTLQFTISKLNPNEKVKVGMPIWVGPNGDPWACNEEVLHNMTEEEENGKTILHWIGTTNENGVLTVNGTVKEGLPSGELCITLPEYGYVINNAIRLQDHQGDNVFVGAQP